MKLVITGAAGMIGHKLAPHLQARHDIVCIDKTADDASGAICANLSVWDDGWVSAFAGADALIHLAASSVAQAPWADVIESNIDAALNVFTAAEQMRVARLVFASSNHVMGGYKDLLGPGELTIDLPPKPGARYDVGGEQRDSSAYAATKLFGERLGRHYAARCSMTVIAVRIGWNKPAPNRWEDIPRERGAWFRSMWFSDRDCLQLFTRCVEQDVSPGFYIVHGMSANRGMPWDISAGRQLLGYVPEDGAPEY